MSAVRPRTICGERILETLLREVALRSAVAHPCQNRARLCLWLPDYWCASHSGITSHVHNNFFRQGPTEFGFVRMASFALKVLAALSLLVVMRSPVIAQRLLGVDIWAHQDNLTSSNWTGLNTTNSRAFVIIRASRGGTTGFDHGQD